MEQTKPLPDVLLIAEDDLRARLMEMSPQLTDHAGGLSLVPGKQRWVGALCNWP
jgi:hypothetical protein